LPAFERSVAAATYEFSRNLRGNKNSSSAGGVLPTFEGDIVPQTRPFQKRAHPTQAEPIKHVAGVVKAHVQGDL